jgi:hypothetical protein
LVYLCHVDPRYTSRPTRQATESINSRTTTARRDSLRWSAITASSQAITPLPAQSGTNAKSDTTRPRYSQRSNDSIHAGRLRKGNAKEAIHRSKETQDLGSQGALNQPLLLFFPQGFNKDRLVLALATRGRVALEGEIIITELLGMLGQTGDAIAA